MRGAPAIAIVGILSVAIELNRFASMDKKEIHENISNWLDYLVTSRPTAVNMRNAAQQFKVSLTIFYSRVSVIENCVLSRLVVLERLSTPGTMASSHIAACAYFEVGRFANVGIQCGNKLKMNFITNIQKDF